MAIAVGERIPSVKLKAVTPEEIRDASTDELFSGRKAVLFTVPGAFTPLCSAQHLPGFVEKADALRERGVDAIYCLSVNDPFVMQAWARDRGVGDRVVLLADGNADLTRALGIELDASRAGMGVRAQRAAFVVDDGVVVHAAVEAPMKFEVSSADAILRAL